MTRLSSSRWAAWSTTAAGASYISRDLMPTSRFSHMSMRPTPWAPAIVSRLAMSSTRGIATPLTAVGAPRSKSTLT